MRIETITGSSRSPPARGQACRVLAIAPSTYYEHVRRRQELETAPPRIKRDAALMQEIRRVFDDNFQVYGARKIWRQLKREGLEIGRCTIERLMRKMGLSGVIRGKRVRRRLPTKRRTARRSRRPAIPRRPSECAVGLGLHLRGDVGRLRLRCFRDRKLTPAG